MMKRKKRPADVIQVLIGHFSFIVSLFFYTYFWNIEQKKNFSLEIANNIVQTFIAFGMRSIWSEKENIYVFSCLIALEALENNRYVSVYICTIFVWACVHFTQT